MTEVRWTSADVQGLLERYITSTLTTVRPAACLDVQCVGPHAYASLEDALRALEETGALAAIDACWRAQSDASQARSAAFSRIMSAHIRADESYTELLRARRKQERARAEGC